MIMIETHRLLILNQKIMKPKLNSEWNDFIQFSVAIIPRKSIDKSFAAIWRSSFTFIYTSL
jgi:hypothetical protein